MNRKPNKHIFSFFIFFLDKVRPFFLFFIFMNRKETITLTTVDYETFQSQIIDTKTAKNMYH
jgi:hypothetical protein